MIKLFFIQLKLFIVLTTLLVFSANTAIAKIITANQINASKVALNTSITQTLKEYANTLQNHASNMNTLYQYHVQYHDQYNAEYFKKLGHTIITTIINKNDKEKLNEFGIVDTSFENYSKNQQIMYPIHKKEVESFIEELKKHENFMQKTKQSFSDVLSNAKSNNNPNLLTQISNNCDYINEYLFELYQTLHYLSSAAASIESIYASKIDLNIDIINQINVEVVLVHDPFMEIGSLNIDKLRDIKVKIRDYIIRLEQQKKQTKIKLDYFNNENKITFTQPQ